MRKFASLFLVTMLAVLMLSCFVLSAVADTDSTDPTSTSSSSSTSSSDSTSVSSGTTPEQVGVPNVSQEQFTSKTSGIFYKFYDAIRTISTPLVLFLFALCIIAAVFSEKARVASLICLVALGCIYYAPTIVGYIVNTISAG